MAWICLLQSRTWGIAGDGYSGGMQVIEDAGKMQALARRWQVAGKKAVLVPTMGALHAGHLALIERAHRLGDRVVVSIYVNPAQFGPREDLARYPRPRRADLARCRQAGVDAVFAPRGLYAGDFSTWVVEERESRGRCGGSRPGHFRGVATVVLKLFNLVQPQAAVFGQKDAQQVDVIRRMVRDLQVPVRIETVETVRDRDGLALSSRNAYLSAGERQKALALPLLLHAAVGRRRPAAWLRRELGRTPGLVLEYVEAVNGRLCAAVRVGKTRLIDNVPL
jgi:pantoate--beta-alanine ligase